MMPVLTECDRYYFDGEAADRPIRFAAKYLRHYEGKFAGKPFTFLPWEEDVTRALFGWRRRDSGLRRFSSMYMLTAKGSGKTPWLAAIGMYMLLMDDEQGAHVMSCATDYQQANLTLDAAKKYIGANKALAKACDPIQYEIRVPKSNSKWTVLSGTSEGRHGFRPSCLLMDEAHEWPNGRLYDNLSANLPKRQQPLLLVATNAGASENCFCWKLHERALAVLNGDKNASETLLPVIYEAPETMAWDSEEAARAANPSLGEIITFEQLAPELAKAKESPEAEARYRRLFLSQWQTTGTGRWIDLAAWDECTAESAEAAAPPADAPTYIGVDLAESDDWCAVTMAWPTAEDQLYIDSHFWIPKATADSYEQRYSIPYSAWARAGYITLLDTPTVTAKARQDIAAFILDVHKRRKIHAVCFDPHRADETVAILDAAGLTCVSIIQGFKTSTGCFELERHVKQRSAVIAPNDALRFCIENAEIVRNSYGSIRVVKPDDRARLSRKVDGASALVSSLVEAKRHHFPEKKKTWSAVWTG